MTEGSHSCEPLLRCRPTERQRRPGHAGRIATSREPGTRLKARAARGSDTAPPASGRRTGPGSARERGTVEMRRCGADRSPRAPAPAPFAGQRRRMRVEPREVQASRPDTDERFSILPEDKSMGVDAKSAPGEAAGVAPLSQAGSSAAITIPPVDEELLEAPERGSA